MTKEINYLWVNCGIVIERDSNLDKSDQEDIKKFIHNKIDEAIKSLNKNMYFNAKIRSNWISVIKQSPVVIQLKEV
jgi:hypothetical protein